MILYPFQVSDSEYVVFACLDDDSIERIRTYDPAEVRAHRLTELSGDPLWSRLRMRDVIIGYANEADIAEVRRLQAVGGVKAALQYLSRGWAFRPDKGDGGKAGPLMADGKPGA